MRTRGRSIVVALLGCSLALLATTAPVARGAPTATAQRTEVDVTQDTTHRYGEAEVAVNPKNPNNLVHFVMQEAYT